MDTGARAAATAVLTGLLVWSPVVGAGAADWAVRVVDSAYDPAEVTVSAGDRVVWRHVGSLPHSVTAHDGSWDSHPGCGGRGACMVNGDTFTRTFDEPGRYAYYCRLHPAMKGDVVVQPAAQEPSPEPTSEPPSPVPTSEEPSPEPTSEQPAPDEPSPEPTSEPSPEPTAAPSPAVSTPTASHDQQDPAEDPTTGGPAVDRPPTDEPAEPTTSPTGSGTDVDGPASEPTGAPTVAASETAARGQGPATWALVVALIAGATAVVSAIVLRRRGVI